MSKLETNTIDTVSGTSTLQVGSTNTSTITLGVSGDTINVPSGVTIANSGTATGFGGDNTPAFRAYLNSDQTINDATNTVVSLANEDYDTDSAFDTSSYRFTVPSGKAGKYFFYGQIQFEGLTSPAQLRFQIQKNGSAIVENYVYSGGTGTSIFNEANDNLHFNLSGSTVVSLSASDYIDITALQDPTNTDSGVVSGGSKNTFFYGYKLVE